MSVNLSRRDVLKTFALFCLSPWPPAWKAVNTKYMTIKYQEAKDLTSLFQKIKHIRKRNVNQVDLLLERVQEILGMHKDLKMTLYLYKDSEQLGRAYKAICGKFCEVRAWYWYRNNAIYINIQDVNRQILAHELAHAIVDHHFGMRAPSKTGEILANYVTKNLDRE